VLRRRDAPFGLLLKHMQDVNGLWEPHVIDGPERIAPEVGNNLQDARRNTFQWIGVLRHPAPLDALQRKPNLVFDLFRQFAQHLQRIPYEA
jgi:hypothetical protein